MIARARPLLGTIVAVRVDGDEAAVRAAFAAVERVHALMNFHATSGDVARINSARPGKPVPVDPWTYEVLRHAAEVSELSSGAFDVTVPGAGACHADIELLGEHKVKLRRRTRVDLGGIAKGFAVDRAVEALRRCGATRGCVNAGGDLRRFGVQEAPIRVRLPGTPTHAVCLPRVTQEAFATSAAYFDGTIDDRHAGRRLELDESITVCAPSCATADALTKAIAILGPVAVLLQRFGARAFAIDRHGRLYASAG